MKVVIAIACLFVAITVAAPAEKEIKILRSEILKNAEGSYSVSFETEDGIQRNEVGEPKQILDADNKPQTVVVIRGSYTYPDPSGKIQTITYYADETGFHAEGEGIPKA